MGEAVFPTASPPGDGRWGCPPSSIFPTCFLLPEVKRGQKQTLDLSCQSLLAGGRACPGLASSTSCPVSAAVRPASHRRDRPEASGAGVPPRCPAHPRRPELRPDRPPGSLLPLGRSVGLRAQPHLFTPLGRRCSHWDKHPVPRGEPPHSLGRAVGTWSSGNKNRIPRSLPLGAGGPAGRVARPEEGRPSGGGCRPGGGRFLLKLGVPGGGSRVGGVGTLIFRGRREVGSVQPRPDVTCRDV